jgi:hypothetical protein
MHNTAECGEAIAAAWAMMVPSAASGNASK